MISKVCILIMLASFLVFPLVYIYLPCFCENRVFLYQFFGFFPCLRLERAYGACSLVPFYLFQLRSYFYIKVDDFSFATAVIRSERFLFRDVCNHSDHRIFSLPFSHLYSSLSLSDLEVDEHSSLLPVSQVVSFPGDLSTPTPVISEGNATGSDDIVVTLSSVPTDARAIVVSMFGLIDSTFKRFYECGIFIFYFPFLAYPSL